MEARNEALRAVTVTDVVTADPVAATAAVAAGNGTVGLRGSESPAIQALKQELEEREQDFYKQNRRHPSIADIKSDEAWNKLLARVHEHESRYSVSHLLGAGSGSPLGQRSDALAVESKFREMVGKQSGREAMAAAANKFRACAEKDASSAQLNEHVSLRLKETSSRTAIYYLTKEGLRTVRDAMRVITMMFYLDDIT